MNRRVVALGAGLIVLVLVGLVLWQSGAFSPTPAFAFDTTLSILKGQVLVQPGGVGNFVPAKDGQTLKAGDRVRTEADSYALITFFDGSTVELEPKTDVTLEELQKPTAERPATTIRLTQWVGVSWSRVERLADPAARYEVQTPSAVALVRGTLVEVQVKPDETTTVKNVEGVVVVRAQQVEVTVPVGQESRVDPGQPPSPPIPSPPPTNRLRIVMQSPVWTRVVDPLGRSAGTTDPGINVNQIPGSTVTVPFQEPETVVIPEAIAGRYTIVLEGRGQGGFRLLVQGISGPDQVFSQEVSGNAEPGQRFQAGLDIAYQDGRLTGVTLDSLVALTGEAPGKVVKMERAVRSVPLTATAVVLSTPAFTPTSTLTPTATVTGTRTVTATPSPSPTLAATATRTATPLPTATATRAATPLPPTPAPAAEEPTPAPAATAVPAPTAAPATATPVPPTATAVPPTATPSSPQPPR